MKFSQILPHFISGRPITRKRFQLKHRQCKTYCFISELRDGKRWVAAGDSYSEPRYYDHFSLADIYADDWEINQHFVPREWHKKYGGSNDSLASAVDETSNRRTKKEDAN